ncbi:hypothetical protein [Sulfurovum mangrovi]|uniref:hypothetical protein n=1 Tax=Sulfurovum mangrovi TaxID=2893889 RepID=UPI001E2E3FB9|nr:hypothetical protein [Sulfurovum mangrovi]UFH58636.1 hypothetical protein LN246_09770 [Sulfurovum mangrovi]
MPFGDIVYIFAFVLFAFMTFVIIRNYFRNKFDNEGRRKDMKNTKDENKSS